MTSTGNGTWYAQMDSGLGKAIRSKLDLGLKIREIELSNRIFCVVPEALPYLGESDLEHVMRMLPSEECLSSPQISQWDLAADALKRGTFLSADRFLSIIEEPIYLKVRQMLSAYGLDMDTEPSHETDVRIHRPEPMWNINVFRDAYPDVKTLEFHERKRYTLSYAGFYFIPYMTAAEIEKFAPCTRKQSLSYGNIREYLAENMVNGTFAEPEFFVRNIYTGTAGVKARLTLIKENPSLARLMLKDDLMKLIGVKGVLQYALDRGWVTRFNHDKVFNGLADDEDRAVLLKWDEEHGMQAQMEKLGETRRNADAFSTSTMRQNWLVHHAEDGIHLTLRRSVNTDVISIPAAVAGRPVTSVSLAPKPSDSDTGSIPWRSIRKIMLDSALGNNIGMKIESMSYFGSHLRGEILDLIANFDDVENFSVETFGEGPLKAVPGALILNRRIIGSLPGDELVLPEGITSIPDGGISFRGGYRFSKIVLPDSLAKIGSGAFAGNAKLTEIDIPCEVGDNAFANCTNLRKVRINGNIGRDAFWACNCLLEIEFGPGVRQIDSGAFTSDKFGNSLPEVPAIRSVRLFRADVKSSSFAGRRILDAEFTACSFDSAGDISDLAHPSLEAEHLTLNRCTGTIPTAKPLTEHGRLSINGGDMRGNFSGYSKADNEKSA